MAVSEKPTILCLLASLFVSPAAAQDSANNPPTESAEISHSEKHLKEVVVTADRGWVEDGKIIFLPSKTEKNLSNSPASLIESMHLPMLKVKDNEIISLSGDKVVIYINGVKANENDLATFWPKLAKRVEYIENPADAKYRGNSYVVNFIMTEYAAGGVTRAATTLATPRYGNFYIASKLVYKKMTFGATISGNSWKDDWDSRRTENFSDLHYNDDYYDRITRESNETSTARSRYLQAAVNARYTNGSFTMTHTAALDFSKRPYERGESSDSWTPGIFASEHSYHDQSSKTFTPQISGDYDAKLAEKWHLTGDWRYAHSQNNSGSINSMGETSPIANGNLEEVNSVKFSITPVFIPNNKWFLHLNLKGSLDWFDTQYSGSSQAHSKMRRDEWSVQFRAYWKPRTDLSISLLPGINISHWKTGSFEERLVRPLLESQITWSATKKLFMGGRVVFSHFPPATSETNPVLTRQSQLLWVKGNPHLKGATDIFALFTSSYLASNWLQLSLTALYDRIHNNTLFDYQTMPDGQDGLLKTPFNSRVDDTFRAYVDCRLSFLDNALTVNVSPNYEYYHSVGRYARSKHSLRVGCDASYTIKNCRFSLNYLTPAESYSDSGTESFWKRDALNFSFTYGNGNLYLRANVEDVLNTRTKWRTTLHSGNYSSITDKYDTGRVFKVYLTYTFGYGKKVDRSIDINGPESISSSVLR